MLLQSKLNPMKAVAEQMKDALRHATIRNISLKANVPLHISKNMAALCPQLFNYYQVYIEQFQIFQ